MILNSAASDQYQVGGFAVPTTISSALFYTTSAETNSNKRVLAADDGGVLIDMLPKALLLKFLNEKTFI